MNIKALGRVLVYAILGLAATFFFTIIGMLVGWATHFAIGFLVMFAGIVGVLHLIVKKLA